MASRVKYSEYFGFSEEEVDELYEKYLTIKKEPHVTREGLRLWYDGYKTADRRRLYNPRSVVGALSEDEALMVTENPVPASVQEYAATSRKDTCCRDRLSQERQNQTA